MKLPRPRIPLKVKLIVAQHQLGHSWSIPGQSGSERLRLMLKQLFANEPYQLDHDPALAVREKIIRKGVVVGYIPDANDPDYLVYRTKTGHGIKTYVRGDGAQLPDVMRIKKIRRIEGKGPKRQSRPLRSASRWPKPGTRKINWETNT